MASIPAETPKTRVPLPPVDAKVTTTACEYCPVACGYKVYTWPVGTEGGPTAGENAFGVDFPTSPLSGRWPSPNMHNTVTIDGRFETYYYEIRREPIVEVCLHRASFTSVRPLTPPAAQVFLSTPDPNGIRFDPSGPGVESPYVCPFSSGSADPEPVLSNGTPLQLYQVPGDRTLLLAKDAAASTLLFTF